MGYTSQIKKYTSEEIKTKEQVSFAYHCHLPFRLEFSEIVKFDCSYEKHNIDIWVYNEYNAVDQHDLEMINYCSRLLIHYKNPELVENIEQINSMVELNDSTFADVSRYMEVVAVAIRRLLMAFLRANRSIFGGHRVYTVSYNDVLYRNFVGWVDIVIASRNFKFEDIEVSNVLKKTKPFITTKNISYANNPHVFGDTIKSVQDFLDKYIDKFLFYELLLDVENKLRLHDYREALIHSAMAFENALYSFIFLKYEKQFEQKNSLLDHNVIVKMEKGLSKKIEKLIKALGIHKLTELTPYLFADDEILFDIDQIKAIQGAIEHRNKFIHSQKTKDDRYYWAESFNSRDIQEKCKLLNNATLIIAQKIEKIM